MSRAAAKGYRKNRIMTMDVVILAIMMILALTIVIPMIHVLAISFARIRPCCCSPPGPPWTPTGPCSTTGASGSDTAPR